MQTKRHQLTLTPNFASDDPAIQNIGKAIAQYIRSSKNKKRLGLKVKDFIHQHLSKEKSPTYIKNIGILFEPALNLNVPLLLSQLSKDQHLIIEWPGEIDVQKQKIYFLSKQGIEIDLSDIGFDFEEKLNPDHHEI